MSFPRFSYATAFLCALFFAVEAPAQERAVVVGAVVSETGAQAALATEYRRALLLWQDGVNAAGGLLGRKVELRLLDDASTASRTAALYRELITGGTDLLIGPYGSAATLVAAAETERAQRVMANGSAPARSVHRRAPRYLFQTLAPYAAYGRGIVELAKASGCTRLLLLGRDDAGSAEMAEGAHALARRIGLTQQEAAQTYSASEANFASLLEQARKQDIQAWVAFGEARDAADMLITFKRQGYAPPVFFASGSAQPRFRSMVGRDAEGSLGLVRYDPRFATPGNAEFVREYTVRWKAAPDHAAAEGFAAATVLGEAVRRAGTLDQEKLRATLSAMEADTIIGRYRVDAASGEQAGVRPAVTQMLKGRTQIVWPPELKTAEPNLRCH